MKTKHQKTAYALARMSKAVDKLIVTKDPKYRKWITAWGRVAGVRPC